MNSLASDVIRIFKENFSKDPHVYYSPGRINFIGEHIDYNDGFVMPAAIDKGIFYAIALNNTDTINFHSVDFGQSLSVKVSEVKKMNGWKNYVLSVVNEFIIKDLQVKGFDCVFHGNIANGAGISSSAAVEGGLAFAINELFGFGFSRKELALLCQRAEHNFPGVMCGIMDQYANMMGKKDHVILLDCRSVEHEYFPLYLSGYEIVLINTRVHHTLASSEYNVRRKQCEEGLLVLKEGLGIQSFRDVKNAEVLLQFEEKMGKEVYMRCMYVVEEIERTQKAAVFLQENNIKDFGELMYQTHTGLSNLYEVSCQELDFLVDLARADENVVGARLMGGGFGGCTINIIKDESVPGFLNRTAEAYQKKFQVDPEIIHVDIVNGTGPYTEMAS
ncbi:MAG: galactokinase [Ginsengibacter sp.]